jgi:hypothetical protein
MIAFRDVLIFAGLMALAAAVIASLFPAGEGVSSVPACSDCAFKLTGGYWIRQYGNYAALYLGTREAARYGWAYVDGRPLVVGEAVRCDPMYVHVLNGLAYVSCNGSNPTFGRTLFVVDVNISAHLSKLGCTYTVNVVYNTPTKVRVKVYDENGRLIYSASGTPPVAFNFDISMAGTYRMHIYAPPLLNEWYTLHAEVNITGTKIVVYRPSEQDIEPDIYAYAGGRMSFPQDLRPNVSLKIIDLTNYRKKKGYGEVLLRLGRSGWYNVIPAPPTPLFAEFILAWADCYPCDRGYADHSYSAQIWRLAFTPSGPVFACVGEGWSGYWRSVHADGNRIYSSPGLQRCRGTVYTGSDPTITVKFVSEDSKMNAEAVFTRVCRWS